MPDIAMCHGEGCPIRDKCWRYTAPPSQPIQTYSEFERKEDGSCPNFWSVTDRDTV